MAETLTFENTTETTTMENLNADEQDSLQVGEAMIDQQENLLAGKYKDAQELEKAYVELQKKLGDKGTGDSSEAGDSQDSEQVESKEDGKKEKETKEDTESNGILDTLWEEAQTEYSKETLEALNKMTSTEIADMHLQFRQQVEQSKPQITEQQVTELNQLVCSYSVPQICSEADAYVKYKRDVSTLAVPLARPLSTYNSNTVELKNFF